MDAASKKRFSSNLLPLHPALFVPPTAQKKQEEGHRVWVLSLDQFNSFFLPWLALLTDWTGCWGTKRERTAFRAALLIQGGLHTRAPPASVGRGGGGGGSSFFYIRFYMVRGGAGQLASSRYYFINTPLLPLSLSFFPFPSFKTHAPHTKKPIHSSSHHIPPKTI